jgi:hypothetical protein
LGQKIRNVSSYDMDCELGFKKLSRIDTERQGKDAARNDCEVPAAIEFVVVDDLIAAVWRRFSATHRCTIAPKKHLE